MSESVSLSVSACNQNEDEDMCIEALAVSRLVILLLNNRFPTKLSAELMAAQTSRDQLPGKLVSPAFKYALWKFDIFLDVLDGEEVIFDIWAPVAF